MAWPERKQNMRGDHFTYSIDISNSEGETLDFIAGVDNVVVANRTFDHLLFYQSENTWLKLREGGRVMRLERGTGEWHEEFRKERDEIHAMVARNATK